MPGIEEVQSASTGVMPSMNEIRLGRKVLDLEKERDELAVSYPFLDGWKLERSAESV
jgi:hypothetical protein